MLWAVVMAGGSGTRFWPESRIRQPKQFLTLFGKTTLLEQTVHRLKKVIPRSRVLVVTQASKVLQVSRLLNLPKSQILGEPVGRNTAPCAALAAAVVLRRDPNAVLAILPSDHRIGKERAFHRYLKAAAELADESGLPVTFGIRPTYPHTGFGYLELSQKVGRKRGVPVYRLKKFHEKPNLAAAKKYVRSRKYLWNSGIFVWRAGQLQKTAEKVQPQMSRLIARIRPGRLTQDLKKFFPRMPNVSMDYGLMEHLKGRILALPVEMEWNDLGGWQSFDHLWPRDRSGNRTQGPSLAVESSNNILKSNGRLIALLGVKDFVVVDTPDALLVCPKAQTESIRKIVESLKKKKLNRYL